LKGNMDFNSEFCSDLEKLKVEIATKLDRLQASFLQRMDAIEQYGRRNNMRSYGLPEEEQENTSALVAANLTRTLGVHVNEEDIDVSHRLGRPQRQNQNRPRSIIVRFVRRELRSKLLSRRKHLKGSGVSLAPDLTPTRMKLLNYAKDH